MLPASFGSVGSRVALVLSAALLVWGGGTSAGGQDVGAGAFSRLGFDARGVALGNALVGASSNNASPYYNPALLPTAQGQRVSGSAALLAFDRQMQSLEFVAPLGPTAGVGLGLLHGGVGEIDGRNADGIHTETLSTDEFALSLAFGNRFGERLSAGVSFTLYQSDLLPEADPVRGFGLEFGVTYRATSRLKLGGRVTDLLAKYEWDTSSLNGQSRTDRFPVRVLLGGSYTLVDERVELLAELESRFQARDRTVPDRVRPTTGGPRQETRTEGVLLRSLRGRLGVSYHPINILELRVGGDRIGVNGIDGLRPSAGFGLRQQLGELDLRLSYAAALEPHVRTVMSLATIEVFL